jgi:hypothetical protein
MAFMDLSYDHHGPDEAAARLDERWGDEAVTAASAPGASHAR